MVDDKTWFDIKHRIFKYAEDSGIYIPGGDLNALRDYYDHMLDMYEESRAYYILMEMAIFGRDLQKDANGNPYVAMTRVACEN